MLVHLPHRLNCQILALKDVFHQFNACGSAFRHTLQFQQSLLRDCAFLFELSPNVMAMDSSSSHYYDYSLSKFSKLLWSIRNPLQLVDIILFETDKVNFFVKRLVNWSLFVFVSLLDGSEVHLSRWSGRRGSHCRALNLVVVARRSFFSNALSDLRLLPFGLVEGEIMLTFLPWHVAHSTLDWILELFIVESLRCHILMLFLLWDRSPDRLGWLTRTLDHFTLDIWRKVSRLHRASIAAMIHVNVLMTARFSRPTSLPVFGRNRIANHFITTTTWCTEGAIRKVTRIYWLQMLEVKIRSRWLGSNKRLIVWAATMSVYLFSSIWWRIASLLNECLTFAHETLPF